MKNLFSKSLLLVLAVAVFAACDTTQDPALYSGDEFVRFGSDSYSVIMLDNEQTIDIEVGLVTDQLPTSSLDFTVSINEELSSAVQDVHYRLPSNTVQIAAGSVKSTLQVVALKENLTDPVTLVLEFEGTNFNQQTTIFITNPIRDELVGDYAISFPVLFGAGAFAQEVIASANDPSAITALGIITPGLDVDMIVNPTADDNIYNITIPAQEAWAFQGQPVALLTPAGQPGTYNRETGVMNLIVNLQLPDGNLLVAGGNPNFDMTLTKLPDTGKSMLNGQKPEANISFD